MTPVVILLFSSLSMQVANSKAVVKGRFCLNQSLRANQELNLFKQSFQAAFVSEAAAPQSAGWWDCRRVLVVAVSAAEELQ